MSEYVMSQEELNNFGKDLINDALIQMKTDLGLDKVDFKYKIVPNGEEDDQLKKDYKWRTGNFIKNLYYLSKGKITKEEYVKTLDPQDEGTPGDGGYLVPDVTRAEILRLIEQFGQARQYMRSIPMGKAKVVNIPRKLTGATVSRVGENNAIPDMKVTLDQVTLTASKAATIVAFTNELVEDAIVDIGAYVTSLIGEAFWQEEDTQFWSGTGAPHTGLFNVIHTFGNNGVNDSVATINDVSYGQLVDMSRSLRSNHLVGAAWYANRAILAVLEKLLDKNDRPLLSFIAGDPLRPSLFGYPVRAIEAAPSAPGAGQPFLILGNAQYCLIGQKRDITMKVLEEATVDGINLAENDLVGLRVTKRDAFAVGIPAAFAALKINM